MDHLTVEYSRARSQNMVAHPDADRALASQYAPVVRFDRNEPFLPDLVGYTLFRQPGESPSFPRRIALPEGVALVIEYAIWWDWDIQHLYELEHIWVYLDVQGQIVDAEASWHGTYHTMRDAAGRLPLENGRLTLFSEPGKHAFAPTAERLFARAGATCRDCDALAGIRGLHITDLFSRKLRPRRNPNVNWLVVRYLRQQRFTPSFDFAKIVDLRALEHVPWEALERWIPQRVAWWTRRLYALMLQDRRQQLQASLNEVDALEGLPAGFVHILDPIYDTVFEPPRTAVSRFLWPGVMALLVALMVTTRSLWLGWQQAQGLLHRAGFMDEPGFARFKADVRAELASLHLTDSLPAPPRPVPVLIDRRRL